MLPQTRAALSCFGRTLRRAALTCALAGLLAGAAPAGAAEHVRHFGSINAAGK